MKRKHSSQAGFSLIELMVAVAVLGILAGIAFPSYTTYVERARRADAAAVLSEAAIQLERYHAANGTYAGAPLPATLAPKGASAADAYYVIGFEGVPDADAFTLTATPINAQAPSACGRLALDQNGNKRAAASGCW